MLGVASTVLSVALGAVHASPDRPVLRETSLGPSGDSLVVSRDRRHVARLIKRNGQKVVLVDGKESPADGGVQFAAFDPESRRFAFVTKRDGRSRLVVDGVEAWDWKGPGLFGLVRSGFWFSREGGHWFFMTGRKGLALSEFQNPGEYQLVVDGKVASDGIESVAFIGRNGGRYGFLARRPDSTGKLVMTLVIQGDDGEEGRFPGVSDDCHCSTSPDARRLTYSIRRGDQWALVTDGVAGTEYEAVRGPVWSPDSRRLAYFARRSGKWVAVVDGREEGPWDDIKGENPSFNADGSRLAYRAQRDAKWILVVDGTAGEPVEEVGGVVFSPDGKRVAYAARSQGRWAVVVDGRPGTSYEDIKEAASAPGAVIFDMAFTADGQHVVYRARKANQWLIVAGDREGPPYDEVGPVMPGPDGRHLAYTARSGSRWVLVVDGMEQGEYDFLTDRRIVFDGPRQLHTVIRRGNEYFLLELELAQ